MTYISATTRGRVASLAWSVASARPAVCEVCSPAPTIKKDSAAAPWPTQGGVATAPPPDSTSKAKGMIARPKNWISVPPHIKGARFQPKAERCVSDWKPVIARSGATSSGKASISDTSQAETCSSKIITRLSVPSISARVMPMVNLNKDRRSKRRSGRSALAASAKGMYCGPSVAHAWMARWASGMRLDVFMGAAARGLERCRSRWPPAACGRR